MKKIGILLAYLLVSIAAYTFVMPLQSVLAASGEFQADYTVQYDVAPTGTTIVTQNVTLTNEQTNLYPQKYSIIIDSEKIKNIIAFDESGLVTPEITQQDGKTDIILPFNDKVVGLGRQLHFSLRYEDQEIAQKNGKIWEINIPGVANDPDLQTYVVTLHVPPTFGPNAYLTPPPATNNTWTKDQMVSGGISAAYGSEQVFALDLSYFVENPNITPRSTEIALPPETAYQRVSVQAIDPKPLNVVTDADGNWLAQYDLLPEQKLTVHAKILVQINLHPRSGVTEPMPNPDLYKKALPYWESQNSNIINLAKTYKTPRDIYDFVTHALTYSYTRVNNSPVRKGAAAALSDPKDAICMEFTDLFVAIARAAGIPAREVVGYAYTTNAKLRPLSLVTDVLHSWPEYYDSQQQIWVPVDPTWANTTGGINYFDKLDFNHVVFAIHGQSSEYPYPAGFYKEHNSNTKDVSVQFTDVRPDFNPAPLRVSYMFPGSVTSGFAENGNVLLQNDHQTALYNTAATVHTEPFDVNVVKQIPEIPPYATVIIPVRIPTYGYFLTGQGRITTDINGSTSVLEFMVVPLAYKFLIPAVCFTIVLVIIVYSFVRKEILWKRSHKQ